MRYAAFLLILWPLVCCEQCDYTAVCVTLSIGAAILLYVVFAISRELRLLAAWGRNHRWPY